MRRAVGAARLSILQTHPILAIELSRRRLASLSKAIGASRPAQLADALFLMIEGAYASSQTLGGRNGSAAALSSAALIRSHGNG